MEFTHLSILALYCVVIIGTDASQSPKDDWQSLWPNTPLPEALSDLLLPFVKIYNSLSDSGTNFPVRREEDKQYWTVFFEHDLYPGKKMSLGFQKHCAIQPLRAGGWDKKLSQSFGRAAWCRLDEFCESPSAIGEDKHCGSSLESMMNFVISKLGKNIKVISSSFAQNQDQYMVEEVNKIGESMVMCHGMNFKNVLFYCYQVNATASYMVPLVASDGTKVKALTICHHDTRGMNPDVLYQVLTVKPGTVPVCHFVGNKAIAWVPNPAVTKSHHPCII